MSGAHRCFVMAYFCFWRTILRTEKSYEGIDYYICGNVTDLPAEFKFSFFPYASCFDPPCRLGNIGISLLRDCPLAQAVSRLLPTAAVRVRARFRSCGICGGKSGTGAGFFWVLRFPLPIHIPPIPPQSSSIIWGWYNRPKSGHGTKWTQSHP
jgi:hypothetical protein